VWEQYDSERGVSFVAQAFDWAIQDFMEQLRKQVPVQRSINLNDPADNPAADDDDNPPEPERPDMMTMNSLETKATATKRRLVAERLSCLSARERRVIEGRLGLNGYQQPRTLEHLAAELSMSVRHIARIEQIAVEKLQQAVR
jgi:RNA polymerase sigma factor (sigma-70 family)